MTAKRILIILAVAVGVLIVILLIGRSRFADRHAVEVAVESASFQTIVETVRADGKVYPEKEVSLSVEVPGEVVGIYVEEGDSVRRGDLLVTIDESTFQSSVAQSSAGYQQALASVEQAKVRVTQAEDRLAQARMEYERSQGLFEKAVIPEAEFQQAETAFRTAQSDVEAARRQVEVAEQQARSAQAVLTEADQTLRKTRLTAPSSGVVSRLNVELGETVVGTSQMAGTEIVTISDLSRFEVRVDVGETDILKIQPGDSVDVDVDAYRDRTFTGLVRTVAYSAKQTLDQQTARFEVRIRIQPSSYADLLETTGGYPFRPGMSATVEIQTDRQEDVLAVPVQSVTLRSDDEDGPSREVVFGVSEEGRTVMIPVETGIQDDRHIRILSGIEEGRDVISAPFKAISRELSDSTRVRVVDEDDLYD